MVQIQRFFGKNVQIVTPHQQAVGYTPPSIVFENETSIKGNGGLMPELEVLDLHAVKAHHTYKVKFLVDTLAYLSPSSRFRAEQELYYINNGFSIYDVTDSDSLIYQESPDRFSMDNLLYNRVLDSWYLEQATSDPLVGIQFRFTSVKGDGYSVVQ